MSERRRYRPRQEVLFGYLRIEACMRLPGAYRSLPRPSSVPKPSHPSGGLSCRIYYGTHTRLTLSRGLCTAFIANRSSQTTATPLVSELSLRDRIIVRLGLQSLFCFPVRS